jgi:hypothetical protein
MNERIKELYTQVCMEQNLPFTLEHNSAYMLDAFADKFAELIVREYSYDVMNLHGASPERVAMAAKHWEVEL